MEKDPRAYHVMPDRVATLKTIVPMSDAKTPTFGKSPSLSPTTVRAYLRDGRLVGEFQCATLTSHQANSCSRRWPLRRRWGRAARGVARAATIRAVIVSRNCC